MHIRLAETPADYAVFRDLLVEYEESLPLELKHSDFDQEIADLPRYYGPPSVALITLHDDVPAGCVALVPLDASTAIMKKLYVTPASRNLGVARMLCAALVNAARVRSYARVVLDTDRDRLPEAYRLYLSLGFTKCEPYGEVDHGCPTFLELNVG